MKLITNRIANPAGNAPKWSDWVANLMKDAAANAASQQIKEASDKAAPGIGMDTDDEPRGQMRGQVVNTEGEEDMTNNPESPKQGGNARPDQGGTTDQKDHEQSDKEGAAEEVETKEAKCGKEMGESDDAGKVTEDHTEASPGDDENPEPKVLINNDPNYQKGESTNPGKAKGDNKKQPGEPVSAQLASKFRKVASMDRLQKLVFFASLSSNKEYPIEYSEAMAGIKVANLTSEEKEWFKDFWQTLYPPEYVAEMVADR